MHYDTVENYSMKCRLYPSSIQKQKIESALTAVRVFHNCLIYDIWKNKLHCVEKPNKYSAEGKVVHFVDLSTPFAAAYKNALIKQHPIIKACPQAALTTNVGLKADIQKEIDKNKPIEYQKPRYYNEQRLRLSYTYQEKARKIHIKENRNVLYVNLAVIGTVKVRGWNQRLRFDNERTDFAAWAAANPDADITVTVSKDMADAYYIVFKIKKCLKPFSMPTQDCVGIDVGEKNLAVCSDGQIFENPKYKKVKRKRQKALHRRLSRRWGPSNRVYREAVKNIVECRRQYFSQPGTNKDGTLPEMIRPSRRYAKTRKAHARLNRRIARRRDHQNHLVSRRIVEENRTIAVEVINIRDLKHHRYLANALRDAAIGNLLKNIEYKSAWHNRTVQSIGLWVPSDRRCSSCGYIYSSKDDYRLPPWKTSIKQWKCPICGVNHDSEINAAKNILFYANNQKILSEANV